MATPAGTPGPDAHHAYRTGLITATIVAAVALAALYWTGIVSLGVAGFAVVVGFPAYFVFVAVLLGVWLGFDKDATDLRPVYRDPDASDPSLRE